MRQEGSANEIMYLPQEVVYFQGRAVVYMFCNEIYSKMYLLLEIDVNRGLFINLF